MSFHQTLPLFLSVGLFIVQNYMRHQAIETNEKLLRPEYDFIIVGSGSAGSVVAGRLAQNPHVNVLLLEAGGPSGGNTDIPGSPAYFQFFNSPIDWNYTMEEQPVGRAFINERISASKGMVIGGSSSVNTMIYNRGNPRDYDKWESKYGAKGWRYDQVFPYFLKYEKNLDPLIANNGFHSTSGPIEITSWANPSPIILLHQKILQHEWGIREVDINGASQRGTMILQAFIDRNGVRSSASNSYIDPNPYPNNLHILVNSFVTKILIEGQKAVGVQFVRNGHQQQVFAKREVIVSAGAFNSPQLLMLSGIGPKEDLKHFNIPVVADLPVGRNLQNHIGVTMNMLIKDKYSYLAGELPSGSMTQLNQLYANKRGPMGDHYRAINYMTTSKNNNPDWPNWDWETGLYLFPQNLTQNWIQYGKRRHEWDIYNTAFLGKPFLFVHTLLNRVRSRGAVRLASANPFYHPIIDEQVLTHPLDMEDLVEGLSITLKFFETSSMAEFMAPMTPIPGCQFCHTGYVYECTSYLRCLIEQTCDNGYHESGTCRMGDPKREDVVVDPRLRVKYVDGLRVCDSSIMPEITNGNTNAPTLMIGEKCADMIAQDNGL